jgi:hypothetical protein
VEQTLAWLEQNKVGQVSTCHGFLESLPPYAASPAPRFHPTLRRKACINQKAPNHQLNILGRRVRRTVRDHVKTLRVEPRGSSHDGLLPDLPSRGHKEPE